MTKDPHVRSWEGIILRVFVGRRQENDQPQLSNELVFPNAHRDRRASWEETHCHTHITQSPGGDGSSWLHTSARMWRLENMTDMHDRALPGKRCAEFPARPHFKSPIPHKNLHMCFCSYHRPAFPHSLNRIHMLTCTVVDRRSADGFQRAICVEASCELQRRCVHMGVSGGTNIHVLLKTTNPICDDDDDASIILD